MKAETLQLIEEFAPRLDGVYTLPDLKTLFGDCTEAAVFKRLNQLVRRKILIKVKRGLYAVPTAALETISTRICPEAYISTGTVLAQALVIGSVPARRVQAVKTGRPRVYRCALGTIEHLSIKPELVFGYEIRSGIRFARPEKAFLDACYFRFKGRSLSFDLGEGVNLDRLDRNLLRQYVSAYDKRFVQHVVSRWEL